MASLYQHVPAQACFNKVDGVAPANWRAQRVISDQNQKFAFETGCNKETVLIWMSTFSNEWQVAS